MRQGQDLGGGWVWPSGSRKISSQRSESRGQTAGRDQATRTLRQVGATYNPDHVGKGKEKSREEVERIESRCHKCLWSLF